MDFEITPYLVIVAILFLMPFMVFALMFLFQGVLSRHFKDDQIFAHRRKSIEKYIAKIFGTTPNF